MRRFPAALLFSLLPLAGAANAQNAEKLYDAGAFRPAADSFAARAARAPDVPAHWYNLGTSLYRLGDVTDARAAWVRAARASPRSSEMRSALRLVEAPDATSAAATAVAWFTPGEVLAGAILFWVAGWTLFALRRRPRYAGTVLLVAVVFGLLGFDKSLEYRRPVALIRSAQTALRVAPFPGANARRAMNAGTTVEILDRYAGWVLVKRGNDRGWLQATEIVRLTDGRE